MAANQVLQALSMMMDRQERREDREASKALSLLSMSIQAESRKAERAQDVMLKEYYNKQAEVMQTEKMFDEYASLSPQDVSSGGKSMISIINNQNEIDISQIDKAINELSSYQTDLQSGLENVKKQQADYRKYESAYWGKNKVLQPYEFESMKEFALTPKDEGGLGYEHTAGFEKAFEAIPATQRASSAIQLSEAISKDIKTDQENQLAYLKGIVLDDDNNDAVDKLTYTYQGKEYPPPEAIVNQLQVLGMQSFSPQAFMDFVYNAEDASGNNPLLDFLRTNKMTAGAFINMEENVQTTSILKEELAGVLSDGGEDENKYDQFADSISGIEDTDTLFRMYESTVSGGTADDFNNYFTVLEEELGRDLGVEWDEWKKEIAPLPSQDPSSSEQFNLSPAGSLYRAALNSVDFPNPIGEMQLLSAILSDPYKRDAVEAGIIGMTDALKHFYTGE